MARFRARLFLLSRARLDSDFGAWRSLVARTVRVGEVPGSNPGAPISRHLAAPAGVVVPGAVLKHCPPGHSLADDRELHAKSGRLRRPLGDGWDGVGFLAEEVRQQWH